MTSIGSNIRLTRYLSPFWQRDFDEIKVLIRSNDPLFLSLNFEKDHLNKLLDAYNASLAYVDKDLHLVEHFLSDRTLEDTYGISGKLHYRTEHLRITKALIDIIFTHNHRIFIS